MSGSMERRYSLFIGGGTGDDNDDDPTDAFPEMRGGIAIARETDLK